MDFLPPIKSQLSVCWFKLTATSSCPVDWAKNWIADVFPTPVSPTIRAGSFILIHIAMNSKSLAAGRVKKYGRSCCSASIFFFLINFVKPTRPILMASLVWVNVGDLSSTRWNIRSEVTLKRWANFVACSIPALPKCEQKQSKPWKEKNSEHQIKIWHKIWLL